MLDSFRKILKASKNLKQLIQNYKLLKKIYL